MLVTRHRRAAMQNEDRVAIFVVCSRKAMEMETYPALSLALYIAIAAVVRSYAGSSAIALTAQRFVAA